MARTFQGVTFQPRSTSLRPPHPPLSSPIFWADMGPVVAQQIGSDSVILAPERCDVYDADDKATQAYEKVGSTPSCIVPFKHEDPYTGFPVVVKPSEPTLDGFLDQYGERMYTAPLDAPSSRIKPDFLPLIYQWALQIIAGLAFVHSHDIIFGNISTAHCWLSHDYRLSLVLFLNAGWGNGKVRGDWEGIHESYLGGQKDLSMETDLMLYGWTVYELMTAFIPSTRSMSRSWTRPIRESWQEQPWPRLDDDCMGSIVRKCSSGGFGSAEEVKAEITKFLSSLGWEVDENCCLKGMETAMLFA